VDIHWNEQLVDQLDWHWTHHLRPRIDGLTDHEYFWQPVPGAWSLRSPGAGVAADALGAGDLLMDWEYPAPEPTPVPTIAWRLAHLIVGVFGQRTASHFGGPSIDHDRFVYAATASEALDQIDDAYAGWTAGVRSLGEAGLAQPCGPAEGPFAEYSMTALVLHINREAIHHGAEVALLRDLYAHR
jgi:hypothetical protein